MRQCMLNMENALGRVISHTHTHTPRSRPARRQSSLPSECPVREDWDAEIITSMHHETKTTHQWVQQLPQELEQVARESKPMGTPWLLGEVMCSRRSSLTHQVQQANGQAFRFGMEQGDLSEKTS